MAYFSTAYFPSLEYIALLCNESKVWIEYYETYPKQTHRNRCYIAGANGLLPLSVPVKRIHGNHTLTAEVVIDYGQPWFKKHWRAIESAYRKSPFFEYYAPEIWDTLKNPYERLVDLNISLFRVIAKRLKLEQEIIPTEDFLHQVNFKDYRQTDYRKDNVYNPTLPSYKQVFDDRYPFSPKVSVLDILFNLGPEAVLYWKEVATLRKAHL